MTKTERDKALKAVEAAGVVGAGGGGFPTHIKLNTSAEWVIANGVECEPLLAKDRAVMEHNSDELIEGLLAIKELVGANRVTLAIKKKNRDLESLLKERCEKAGIELFWMENIYPAGDEVVLAYEVTGRRVPPGGLPKDEGLVICNVETAVNVAVALKGKSVETKWVSVVGDVKSPSTFLVPLGTSFRDLIEAAGGSNTCDFAIITGGLMMGSPGALSDTVNKTTGAVIVLPQDHPYVTRRLSEADRAPKIGHGQCDQCSFCTELCPRYLLGYPVQPHRAMRSLIFSSPGSKEAQMWASLCCGCNLCSYYSCPEGLLPKQICDISKSVLREEKRRWTSEEAQALMRPVHPIRWGRMLPIERLYDRLGVTRYSAKAPYRPFGKAQKESDR